MELENDAQLTGSRPQVPNLQSAIVTPRDDHRRVAQESSRQHLAAVPGQCVL